MSATSSCDRDISSFYYSESDDDASSTATIGHEEYPKESSLEGASFFPNLFQRFDRARLQGYFWKAKYLFRRIQASSNFENIPLPLLKREIEPGQEWLRGAMLCAWGTASILALNVIITIIAVGVGYSGQSEDKYFTYAELYQGDCSVTGNWTTGMHVVINILSSALLAASNYVMQCLSAPSRADVDEAHSRRQWLDIGIISTRNLAVMDNKRKALWGLLLISSLPIHMLYNAAIFSSISNIQYATVVIPQDLEENESLVRDEYEARSFYDYVGSSANDIRAEIFNGTFMKKDLLGCSKQYDVEFNTKSSTLLLMAGRDSLRGFSSLLPLTWVFGDYNHMVEGPSTYPPRFSPTLDMTYIHAGNWNYPKWSFKYKGSNTWSDIDRFTNSYFWPDSVHCQIYFSPAICVAVIACNIVKVYCMYMTARTDHKEIFLTVGDALSSFLDRPDPTTKGHCLLSREDIIYGFRFCNSRTLALDTINPSHDTGFHTSLPQLLPERKRWFRAASWRRWVFTYIVFSACVAVAIALYSRALSSGSADVTGIGSNLGMGKPNSSTILFDGANFIALALLASTPQLVFSALYLLCNGLFTCMLAVAEYNDFATQRKPLRVTWPKGEQRSTYYLSLPYRYSIPLITVSVVIHWLLSQCIFLVKINTFDVHGKRSYYAGRQVTACGWSPLPMFITIIVGGTAMMVLAGFSLRRLRSYMPLASSCSAALSAACHPPPGDENASLKAVMWGEVGGVSFDRMDTTDHMSRYAHCAFTSKEVTTLNMARLYC
ncbi:hypothetical protein F9C07_7328 [Aspergillus flavus]|uniref:DUF6536 domain-containing protein n=1 Tax=Aspergillus flavus (strain ATCC 200026 / FGSC A1120 / IAM 13836 / NRRL 3357 / JCM 12722 / SRRC 167) TaxID=332952 RepID=A0A7U2MNC8_ASPFN|nr:hypothetical protein F9C07_7328 [Aspergillus flavus]